MQLSLPPRGVEVVLLALIIGAAVYDARYRRIPNWLTVSGVLFGIGLNSFLDPVWPGLSFSLKGLLLGFGGYLLLYMLRAMGAGDVKLMAAIGSLVGWQNWAGIFVMTALLGGIAAVLVSVFNRRLGKTIFNVSFILSEMRHGRPAYLKNEELDVKSNKAMRMPHGVVIAVGTLIFLFLSAHFTQ